MKPILPLLALLILAPFARGADPVPTGGITINLATGALIPPKGAGSISLADPAFGGTLPAARLPIGTGAETVAAGDDARFTLAATALQPGAIGTTIQPFSATIPAAYLGATGTTAAAGNDPRIVGAAAATALAAETTRATSTEALAASKPATLIVSQTAGNDATAVRGTNAAYATLSAALGAAQSGDQIELATGNYTLAGVNSTYSKNVRIIGRGSKNSVVAIDASTSLTFSPGYSCYLHDVGFTGASAPTAFTGQYLINLDAAPHEISNCEFSNFAGTAIHLYGGSGSVICHNYFHQVGAGAYIEDYPNVYVTDLTFEYNEVEHTLSNGFTFHAVNSYTASGTGNTSANPDNPVQMYAKNWRINHNISRFNTGLGFEVWHGCAGGTFDDNWVEESPDGFSLDHITNFAVANCHAVNCPISYEANSCRNVTWVNCTLDARPSLSSPDYSSRTVAGSVLIDGASADCHWIGGSIVGGNFNVGTASITGPTNNVTQCSLTGCQLSSSYVFLQHPAGEIDINDNYFTTAEGMSPPGNWLVIDPGAISSNVVGRVGFKRNIVNTSAAGFGIGFEDGNLGYSAMGKVSLLELVGNYCPIATGSGQFDSTGAAIVVQNHNYKDNVAIYNNNPLPNTDQLSPTVAQTVVPGTTINGSSKVRFRVEARVDNQPYIPQYLVRAEWANTANSPGDATCIVSARTQYFTGWQTNALNLLNNGTNLFDATVTDNGNVGAAGSNDQSDIEVHLNVPSSGLYFIRWTVVQLDALDPNDGYLTVVPSVLPETNAAYMAGTGPHVPSAGLSTAERAVVDAITVPNGSTLNVGTGGTLGSAAFSAASAFDPAGAASTGALRPVATHSANYTFTNADQNSVQIFAGSAVGSATATLTAPTSTTFVNGWAVTVKNLNQGPLTLSPPAGTTIDTLASLVLPIGTVATVVSDGVNYRTSNVSYIANPAANLVLASPNGASGVPSLRALTNADLPSALNPASITSAGDVGIGNGHYISVLGTQLLYFDTSQFCVRAGTFGPVDSTGAGTTLGSAVRPWPALFLGTNALPFSFQPVAGGLELNHGTPVSSGGSYANLFLGNLTVGGSINGTPVALHRVITGTLSGGTVTLSDANITAASRCLPANEPSGYSGAIGVPYVSAQAAGSVTISSSNTAAANPISITIEN